MKRKVIKPTKKIIECIPKIVGGPYAHIQKVNVLRCIAFTRTWNFLIQNKLKKLPKITFWRPIC